VERSLPKLEARVGELQEQLRALQADQEDAAATAQYLVLLQQLVEAQATLRSLLSAPKLVLPFLQPGRLVRVLPSAFNPQAPLPDFGSLPGLTPADGAGPEEVLARGDYLVYLRSAARVLKEDLRARLRVLRRLGYVDKEGVVSLKGRVAAGIQLSADELVLCELCFSGAFNTLSVEVLAALLSCFVWREKSEKKPA
ncbi:uncharacterized protein HaLaN_27658, partial [Haematococcus lacustris]